MSKTTRFLLAAGLALGLTPAVAQNAPPKPDVTKQFGDWLVRCYPVASPSPCDMYELLAQKESGNRVMSMSFAYAPKQDRYVVQIAVPLGVSLKTGLTIKAGDYASPVMQFRRCDRGGCYVEGMSDAAILSALAKQSGEAKATIASDDGRSLDVNFSLKGFSEARSAMIDLAKQRATEPKPPAEPEAAPDSAE